MKIIGVMFVMAAFVSWCLVRAAALADRNMPPVNPPKPPNPGDSVKKED